MAAVDGCGDAGGGKANAFGLGEESGEAWVGGWIGAINSSAVEVSYALKGNGKIFKSGWSVVSW